MTEADHSAYLDSIRALVAEHGHAVQQVAPDDEESLGWSYTIGLHAAALPELSIVGGLSLRAQRSILNRLAERLRAGETLPLGERDPTVLEGFDVTYLEVSDTTTEDFAVAGRLQSDFRALQVVWPDMENRFPWEPGYSFAPDEQRLLGVTPMGSRDEELVRTAFEQWNRGEWEAALEHVDPDVEWRTAAPLLDLPQVSHGHAGVRAFWQTWRSSWSNIRIEPEEFIPVGDELLVLVRWRATSQAGIEVDQPVAFRFLIRDERTTRFISYWERSEAFEALGLPARD